MLYPFVVLFRSRVFQAFTDVAHIELLFFLIVSSTLVNSQVFFGEALEAANITALIVQLSTVIIELGGLEILLAGWTSFNLFLFKVKVTSFRLKVKY